MCAVPLNYYQESSCRYGEWIRIHNGHIQGQEQNQEQEYLEQDQEYLEQELEQEQEQNNILRQYLNELTEMQMFSFYTYY